MIAESRWERPLNRYADTLYRLALLLDPRPLHAGRRTVAAFERLDWIAVALDDHLERRLVAALAQARPSLADRLRWPRRSPALLPIPAAFWKLPPPTRLALGLRLLRGYAVDEIAAALGRTADDVRGELCAAIGALAGDDPAALDAACRASRIRRVDEPGAERVHLLGCELCRAAAPRSDEAEQQLAHALRTATAAAGLPRVQVEALAGRLRARSGGAAVKQPGRLPAPRLAALVAVVLVVLGLLMAPRGGAPTAARPPSTPTALVEQALARYGAPPDGQGIVHRRYQFATDTPRATLLAETWTDAADPARHRMQLHEERKLREWQSGDGSRSLRYVTYLNEQFCGLTHRDLLLLEGQISRWETGAGDQAMLREARWRSGPWAIGRRYLEQALAAGSLRSLGAGVDGDQAIVTLAATGAPVEGRLLLELDAGNGELREIRQVRYDNGATRSRSVWRLLDEERIDADAARRSGVLTTYPLQRRPREVERPLPILDPACPLWGDEQARSLPRQLGLGWPYVVGFDTLPPGTERAYYAGSPRAVEARDMSYSPDASTLVYIGPGKRLALRPILEYAPPSGPAPKLPEGAVAAGAWLVGLEPRAPGLFAGEALLKNTDAAWPYPYPHPVRVSLLAEGWSRDELLELLRSARRLELADALDQREVIYDPEPIDQAVLDVIVPARQMLEPAPGRTQHAIVERWVRENPASARLRDPYHAPPANGVTETYVRYGSDRGLERYRTEQRRPDGSLVRVDWGDGSAGQSYDSAANLLRTYPDPNWTTYPATGMLGEPLRLLFQYREFSAVADDERTTTLAATLPISRTDYRWALESQQAGRVWRGEPWLFDLDPESITYRVVFDRVTKTIISVQADANNQDGTTPLMRATTRRFEPDAEAPDSAWSFTPPEDVHTVVVDVPAEQSNIGMTSITQSLTETLSAAPAPLWGWPQDGGRRFVRALIPRREGEPDPFIYLSLDQAVAMGAAVDLHYYLGEPDEYKLLQGPRALLTAVLRETPAPWTASKPRQALVGGAERTVWIMEDDGSQRWIIFEIDETLIVLRYSGPQVTEALLSLLPRLMPLEGLAILPPSS